MKEKNHHSCIGNMLRYLVATTFFFALAHAEYKPTKEEKTFYERMQFGPAWSNTFNSSYNGDHVAALKGILVDLGDHKRHALFDTETLRWVCAYDGYVKWGGTPWTGEHGKLVTLQDEKPIFATSTMSGWANENGSFDDKRKIKGFGDMPNGKFLGYSITNDGKESGVSVSYLINGVSVAEIFSSKDQTISRNISLGKRNKNLTLLLCEEKGVWKTNNDEAVCSSGLHVKLSGKSNWKIDGEKLLLEIKSDLTHINVSFIRSTNPIPPLTPVSPREEFMPVRLYKQEIETTATSGTAPEGSSWASDTFTLPTDNPWQANMRFSAFDFLDDDRAALSTWNGDVWIVSGITTTFPKLTWKRIVSGLFEPLGLKVVDGKIYLNCRDQIACIANPDEQVITVSSFNRDVPITSNFHEFSFDLQTDSKGNFYYAKGAPVKGGGRGFDQILPYHGCVYKISKDGKKCEAIATGLRTPGGIGVGPNDEITTGENEGTWQPCCKLNFFTQKDIPVFLGNEATRQDVKKDMHEPLVYFPMTVDNSGGDQVWIPKGVNWGLHEGEMIHLSYGQSSLYRVMKNSVVKIPVTLGSSAMRARFHKDGSLFVLGFRGWQTNASTECAFQRIRYVKENPVLIPDSVTYDKSGATLHFSQTLDAELANDVSSYNVERWNYVRGPQYGSGEFSADKPDREKEKLALTQETHEIKNHDAVKVTAAKLNSDAHTISLTLDGMKPCMTLKIAYDLEDKDGHIIKGETYGTVKK